MGHTDRDDHFDVIVAGAGSSGLYALIRLRRAGFSVRCFETADDVGGTWYWNRYPGARCDVPTTDYTYSFDDDLENAWTWSEKFATQPEILSYLRFVADRYDVRDAIRFSTTVTAARWDAPAGRWRVTLDDGTTASCRYYIMATGCLSLPKLPDIAGIDDFGGAIYSTGRWPHSDPDLAGKRVAVIGTGSSGVQAIPPIARQAARLTVFQRTPSYAVPARNGPQAAEVVELLRTDRAGYRARSRRGVTSLTSEFSARAGWQLTDAERRERFEAAWNAGALGKLIMTVWSDALTDLDANAALTDLIHEKIRSIVADPATASALCPDSYPFGARRPCLDSGYYETFNRDNVKLVDLRQEPIRRITATGITTSAGNHDVDVIVFATGFDAMTGAALAVRPIVGADGVTLAEAWQDGPKTYLGLTVVGFPNLFLITGPGSPSVLANMMVSIEQHVDWVVDRLVEMRAAGFATLEPTVTAQEGWLRHQNDCTMTTLHRLADSWYTGANVEGKVRGVLPYTGGTGPYREICDEVVARGMLGFRLTRADGTVQCNDGEIVRLQPDVRLMLNAAPADAPTLEAMGVDGARQFLAGMIASRAPVRPVAATIDGSLSVPGADLAYRLFRPEAPRRGVIVYFHGGGWVLGSHASDDPLCIDLCRRTGMIVVSIDYRHAPEHRFPTAAEDGYAALCQVASHLETLGIAPGPLLVAGYSAGGNVAAVACQLARDRGGPGIAAQMLLCPVVDHDFGRPSYLAEGMPMSRETMVWFWYHYCDPADRADPRASPLGGDLAGLPPAVVVTCEFDCLHDEGVAYAEKLAGSGVPVTHLDARGHTHSSLTLVDLIQTGAPIRERIAEALLHYAGAEENDRQTHAGPAAGPRQAIEPMLVAGAG